MTPRRSDLRIGRSRNLTRKPVIERVLEIIGEAARRVSEPLRPKNPEIPWSRIIAHRNVLAHEYDEIHQELVWKTATERAYPGANRHPRTPDPAAP